MNKCLIDPYSRQIVAELIPDKEIMIVDKRMLTHLDSIGIVVTKSFKEENNLSSWTIYPKDGKDIFAKAFEQCYFVHGLQQQGYYWIDKKVCDLTTDEALKHVMQAFKNGRLVE